jgi:hypothetical protein
MMQRTLAAVAGGVFALAALACSDSTGTTLSAADVAELSAAFNDVPAAFSNVESSFDRAAPDGFVGDFGQMMRDRGRGPGGPGGLGGPGLGRGFGPGPGFGGLMGGGMLHGLDEFPAGPRPGRVDLANCTLGATGRVTCPDVTHNGITISRSFAFTTTDGTSQDAPDDMTNTVNAILSVAGTVSRPNGVTSTIDHSSNRTVTGLAAGSTERTINAQSHGMETTQFTNRDGVDVTVSHEASDAVNSVVVPITDNHASYPTGGSVERTMTVTMTQGTDAPRSLTRTETITYDGSDTAQLVITTNGETKTCSLPLPHGHPVCN